MLTDTASTSIPLGNSVAEMVQRFGTDVDEALATEWLSTLNEGNRHIKPVKLAAYTRDMKNDRWLLDGTPLRFGRDSKGRLVLFDGQHRLEAVRQASRQRVAEGLPPVVIRFLVYQVDADARIVIDTGAPRTFADQAVIGSGVQYARNIVPIGKRVYNWIYGQSPVPVPTNRLVPTEGEFKEFYLTYMGPLNSAAYWGGYLNQRVRLSPVAGGFAHFLINEAAQPHFDATDVDVAAAFFQQLASGAELVKDHPAKSLRETVARRREVRGAMNTDIGLALILRAWNGFAEERLMAQVTLPDGRTVTNGNLALPKPPVAGWTGDVYKSLHQ